MFPSCFLFHCPLDGMRFTVSRASCFTAGTHHVCCFVYGYEAISSLSSPGNMPGKTGIRQCVIFCPLPVFPNMLISSLCCIMRNTVPVVCSSDEHGLFVLQQAFQRIDRCIKIRLVICGFAVIPGRRVPDGSGNLRLIVLRSFPCRMFEEQIGRIR